MPIDFGIDAILLTVGIFYVLYTLTKGRCGPCNAEGMAPSMVPSPQFGSTGSSSQQSSQQASQQASQQQPLASHVSGTASNWSSGTSGSWFGGWRPWGGYHSGLPSYYDSWYDNPRAYHGIPYHTALAYNSPMYDYSYGWPYKYDEINAENYELVYDENGQQRIIRKAMVVGG